MARTALKWIFGLLLSVFGFFFAGVLVVQYFLGNASTGGLISGIVIGSVGFIPGLILLILALIDGFNSKFDARIAKILEEEDRITPQELAERANTRESRVEASVSRIIKEGLIIVFFDRHTGEFVTQEGKALAERVIGIVNSKRRITLSELVLETGMTEDEIKRIVVGMKKRGLFRGVFDWKQGKILSQEGSKLLAAAVTRCPHCNGDLSEPPLPGEEVKCEYCGQSVTG